MEAVACSELIQRTHEHAYCTPAAKSGGRRALRRRQRRPRRCHRRIAAMASTNGALKRQATRSPVGARCAAATAARASARCGRTSTKVGRHHAPGCADTVSSTSASRKRSKHPPPRCAAAGAGGARGVPRAAPASRGGLQAARPAAARPAIRGAILRLLYQVCRMAAAEPAERRPGGA